MNKKKKLRIIIESKNFSCDIVRPERGVLTFLKSVKKHFMRGKPVYQKLKNGKVIYSAYEDESFIDDGNLKVVIQSI